MPDVITAVSEALGVRKSTESVASEKRIRRQKVIQSAVQRCHNFGRENE